MVMTNSSPPRPKDTHPSKNSEIIPSRGLILRFFRHRAYQRLSFFGFPKKNNFLSRHDVNQCKLKPPVQKTTKYQWQHLTTGPMKGRGSVVVQGRGPLSQTQGDGGFGCSFLSGSGFGFIQIQEVRLQSGLNFGLNFKLGLLFAKILA